MNNFHLTLLSLFSCIFVPVFAQELDENTAFLLNCPVSTESELEFIHSLARAGHPIDIFQEKILLGQEGTVLQLLTDELTSEILLSQAGCFEEKSRSNLKRLFASSTSTEKMGTEFHDDYRSYQNILDQLDYYAKQYPTVVKILKSVGKSHEGRDLYVIHLTAAKNALGSKPLIWVMAGQHAREWIATASAMFFIENLLQNQEILDYFEFAVMPLVNPDGYEYSRTKNRMWRKNRRAPYGVDLNRNWDHRWCEIGKKFKKFSQIIIYFLGSSKQTTTDDYCGPSAASEPEIYATQSYILSLPNRAIGFDVHSYSQLILRNYGWTQKPSPHEQILLKISERMANRMKSLYQVKYTPMLSSGLYPSSGSAEDWLYVKAGIPGFVMEMRDKGQYGFNLPSSQIKPTGMELYFGILTAITSHNITELIPS